VRGPFSADHRKVSGVGFKRISNAARRSQRLSHQRPNQGEKNYRNGRGPGQTKPVPSKAIRGELMSRLLTYRRKEELKRRKRKKGVIRPVSVSRDQGLIAQGRKIGLRRHIHNDSVLGTKEETKR